MLALRGQRDQILNTVDIVRDMGTDIVRADKLTSDLARKKFINIVILYLIIILLFFTDCMVLYLKLFN